MSRRIEALQEAAAKKAQEAYERVEKALERMVKQNQKINFQTVARSANVSTAYLYQSEDFKSRIETLREQQKSRSKPQKAPTASDHSKNVIINALREETKRLKEEITELRRANEALTGRLYQVQSSNDLAERLKKENESLKKQVQELTERLQIHESEHQNASESTSTRPSTPSKAKIIPLYQSVDHPSPHEPEKRSIYEEIEALGINLNSTLKKTMKNASEEQIFRAIEAVKDQISRNEVKNPSGLLNKAIKEGWTKDEPSSLPETPQIQPEQTESTPIIDEDKTLVSSDKLKRLHSLFGE